MRSFLINRMLSNTFLASVNRISQSCCGTFTFFSAPVITHIRTSKVDVVDTTGAGDALTGALAFYMSCYPQLSFAEMVSRAVNIATVTVTVHGVQSSYPTRHEIDDWLFDIDAKTPEQLRLEMLSCEFASSENDKN